MSASPKINFYSEIIFFTLRDKNKIRSWILNAALKEGFLIETVNIIFCTDDYLYDLNAKHLNHNALTDIITFPYSSSKNIIADIYISIERVKENSSTLRIKFLDELHRVIIHGVLHLLGYADKTPSEKIQMTEKEDFYLSLRTF